MIFPFTFTSTFLPWVTKSNSTHPHLVPLRSCTCISSTSLAPHAQGGCMYALRHVSSFSFLFGICWLPDITKRAPDPPQRGRCCRGGCVSHPQPGSKQNCVISATSCPTASCEPKEQRSESPITDISVDKTPVSSLGPVSFVWFGPMASVTFFTTLAGLASLPSGPLYSPQPPATVPKISLLTSVRRLGFHLAGIPTQLFYAETSRHLRTSLQKVHFSIIIEKLPMWQWRYNKLQY